jgi:hypothetical protein
MVDFAALLARSQAAKAAAIPTPRIMTNSEADDRATLTAVRQLEVERLATEALIDKPTPHVEPTSSESELREKLKLDKLVEDDFPFDESQLEMIEGILAHLNNGGQGACATGAAGTGKTTSTKKLVDRLMETSTLAAIDMETYFKSAKDSELNADGEQYERTSRFVPSIALVSFTGKATQQIKKNFPRSWHGNIMTIHRMLAFMPVWEEMWDDELGGLKNRMHFEPTYTASNLLPWDIVIVDEAGMLGLDLWEQLRAALKPSAKIIMIGDINQLPPVHGRSVFGFAMAQWPAWELNHVHRQKDSQDRIVDNAWRILKGQRPESGGNFQMVKFDDLANKASQQVRKFIPNLFKQGIYDPIRDTTITATNGEDGQRGFALGQKPLNREFAIIFNKDNPRYIIDAGRERQKFAVGDKVMATRNDHEQGITNGMTGIITDITANGAWIGDRRRFGTVEEVNAYMKELDEESPDDNDDMSLDDMLESSLAQEQGKKDAKESKDRGPASHIVTVRFGTGDSSFELAFGTLSEVSSLMTAYVVTCHKMQGGECPVVIVILHSAHKAMHYREWLYTAVTRGAEKVILLYTDQALRGVLSKQKIKGATLAQKVESFNALSKEGLLGPAVRVRLAWGSHANVPAIREVGSEMANLMNHDDNANLPTLKGEEEAKNLAEFERMTEEARLHEKYARQREAEQERIARIEAERITRIRQAALDAALARISQMMFAMNMRPVETKDYGTLTPEQRQKAERVVEMLAPPSVPLLTFNPGYYGWPADDSFLDEPTPTPPVTPMPAPKPSLAFLMKKKG